MTCTIIFVISFLTTGYFNRPAHDDFDFIVKTSEYGITGATAYFYDTWNTRWSSILLASVFYKIYITYSTLLPFHIVTLAVSLLALFIFIKSLLSFLKFKSTTRSKIVLSLLAFAGIFYISFSISDSYYWINTSAMYLWNLVAFILFVGIFISKLHFINKLVISIITGIYIGGSSEPFIFILIPSLILFIYLFKIFYQKRNKNSLTILLLFVLCISGSFIYSYMGQGHVNRSEFLPDTTILLKAWILIKSVIKLLGIYLPGRMILAFLFSIPWYYVGLQAEKKSIKVFEDYTGPKLILILWGLFIVTSVVSLVPIVWLMSEMGPPRSWTHISWLLYFSTATTLLILGYKYKANTKLLKLLKRYYVLALFLFILPISIQIFNLSLNYSKAWDQRMNELKKYMESEKSGVITIKKKLPKSGFLHNAEITSNPQHFTNQHLKEYLGSEFEIVLVDP